MSSNPINVPKHLLSRLLYTNPVCLASTYSAIMTLSWITCIDNSGGFICSINSSRDSLNSILEHGIFSLSIPTAENIPLILKIGSSKSNNVDKYVDSNLERVCEGPWCAVGSQGICAWLFCKVIEKINHANPSGPTHVLLRCTIDHAKVNCINWTGKQLTGDLLAFMGSKTFALMSPIAIQGYSHDCMENDVQRST